MVSLSLLLLTLRLGILDVVISMISAIMFCCDLLSVLFDIFLRWVLVVFDALVYRLNRLVKVFLLDRRGNMDAFEETNDMDSVIEHWNFHRLPFNLLLWLLDRLCDI